MKFIFLGALLFSTSYVHADLLKIDCAVGIFEKSMIVGQKRFNVILNNEEYKKFDIGSANISKSKNIQKDVQLLVSNSNVGNFHIRVIADGLKLKNEKVVLNHDSSTNNLFVLGVGSSSEFSTGIDISDFKDPISAGVSVSISYSAQKGFKEQDTLISCYAKPLKP